MKLDRNEALATLGVLVHTMNLDAHASEDERRYLERYLDAVGIHPEDREAVLAEVREHSDVRWHVERIGSRPARIYALQQALLLALSDGHYMPVERTGLERIASLLDIDTVLFEDLERWAMEGEAWQIKGAALLAR